MSRGHKDPVYDVSPATATPGSGQRGGAGGGAAGANAAAHLHQHEDGAASDSSSIEFVADVKPVVLLGPYELRETLRRTDQCVVKLARHTERNTLHEVRIYELARLKKEPTLRLEVEREVLVLRHVSHPYVQRLDDVVHSPGHLYVVLEFCPNGDLLDALAAEANRGAAPGEPGSATHPGVVARLFLQLMTAVAYLHTQGFVHRDIKLEHVQLDANNTVKLSGFHACAAARPARSPKAGHDKSGEWTHSGKAAKEAQQHAQPSDFMMEVPLGSCHYVCPEVIECTEYAALRRISAEAASSLDTSPTAGMYDGRLADVWACGVVLFALSTRMLPFNGPSNGDIFDAIKSRRFHEDAQERVAKLSPHTVALIDAMLERDASRRLTAGEVLQHSFWRAVPSAVRAASRDAPPRSDAAVDEHRDTHDTPQRHPGSAAGEATTVTVSDLSSVAAVSPAPTHGATASTRPAPKLASLRPGGYADLAARRSGSRERSHASSTSHASHAVKTRHVARTKRADWV